MNGRFITLEGIEGAGKSTVAKFVLAYLGRRQIAGRLTREPGGTPLAERIRELVLSRGAESLPDAAELLLMFAARSVHLQNLIEPELAAGRWVICDRFTDATYAYQGAGRRVDPDRIRRLEEWVQGARRPDLTLLIDVPVEMGLARARSRATGTANVRDRFETEQVAFFERVRRVYLERAAAEPERIVVIDGAPSVEAVAAQIARALQSRAWII